MALARSSTGGTPCARSGASQRWTTSTSMHRQSRSASFVVVMGARSRLDARSDGNGRNSFSWIRRRSLTDDRWGLGPYQQFSVLWPCWCASNEEIPRLIRIPRAPGKCPYPSQRHPPSPPSVVGAQAPKQHASRQAGAGPVQFHAGGERRPAPSRRVYKAGRPRSCLIKVPSQMRDVFWDPTSLGYPALRLRRLNPCPESHSTGTPEEITSLNSSSVLERQMRFVRKQRNHVPHVQAETMFPMLICILKCISLRFEDCWKGTTALQPTLQL